MSVPFSTVGEKFADVLEIQRRQATETQSAYDIGLYNGMLMMVANCDQTPYTPLSLPKRGWIGVDLDGTLAHYDGWAGVDHIGTPITAMVERVRGWLDEGKDVRLVTARVSHDGTARRMIEAQRAQRALEDWCLAHLHTVLPITCTKDFAMIELWDDRAVQVETNTGRALQDRLDR